MENCKSESIPFSVPIPLRRIVFHLCRLRPLGAWARLMYRVCAAIIGRSLTELPSTKSVYLMGGAAHRIIPAMSDLDLLIFTEIDTHTVMKLRQTCLRLKKLFWIPGEIIALDDVSLYYLETSGCSLSIHLFGKKQKISGEEVSLAPTVAPNPKSLLMILMRFYSKARNVVARGNANISYYDLLDCRRYLSKIIALDEGTKVTNYISAEKSISLARLFYEAAMVLDKRAKTIVKEIFPQGVPSEISNFLSLQDNVPEQRMFDAEASADVITGLFQQSLNQRAVSNLFPLYLSKDAAICRLMGLTLESWSQVLGRLDSIPPKMFCSVLTEATRERAKRRYFQLPGDIMLNTHEAIRSKLNQLCRLGCYLVNQQYLIDRETLAELAEAQLPKTVEYLKKTHQDASKLSIKELIDGTLCVRQELEKVIFAL